MDIEDLVTMTGSNRCIFIQRSRLGTLFFEHDGTTLHVKGGHIGSKVDRKFRLSELSPDFRCVQKYILGPVYFLTALLALLLFAMKEIRAWLPPEVATAWIGTFFLWIPVTVIGVIHWSAPFLFVTFPSRVANGDVVIVCERKQRDECEAFMAGLIHAIENPGARMEWGQDIAPRLSAVSKRGMGWRTSTCLICGGLCVGLPWVGLPWVGADDQTIGPWISMAVFLCSVCAVAFGVLAWMAKEPLRWAAITGMLMGLVPLFFYM